MEGWRAWVKDEDKWIRYNGSAWVDDTAATGQQQYRWATKTANFTVDKTEADAYKCNASSNITALLPPASSSASVVVTIKNVTNFTVTVDGNGAETTDGATTITLSSKYDSLTVSCDGTDWHIV
jgi:hypothetical protein